MGEICLQGAEREKGIAGHGIADNMNGYLAYRYICAPGFRDPAAPPLAAEDGFHSPAAACQCMLVVLGRDAHIGQGPDMFIPVDDSFIEIEKPILVKLCLLKRIFQCKRFVDLPFIQQAFFNQSTAKLGDIAGIIHAVVV